MNYTTGKGVVKLSDKASKPLWPIEKPQPKAQAPKPQNKK